MGSAIFTCVFAGQVHMWNVKNISGGKRAKMYPNWASQMVLVVKNLPANARDLGSIPELGGGNANLLQYSYLKNIRDRVTKSRTQMQQLSMYTCTHPNYISDSNLTFSSVHSLSRVRLSVTPWTAARQASLSITNSRSPHKLMSIESVMPSSHLILCHPLLPSSIFPSIRVFSSESALHIRWPKYWSFNFNINSSNEHPGLISFRMDWLDLLEVQGTGESLLQHHSSKASILLVLSFLHSPTLTSIHDYWRNHSLDQTDICWQSNVSAF